MTSLSNGPVAVTVAAALLVGVPAARADVAVEILPGASDNIFPTGGTARYFSPLSAASFIKSTQVIHYTKEALAKARASVRKLTDIEGLILHRISLEARFVDSVVNVGEEKANAEKK